MGSMLTCVVGELPKLEELTGLGSIRAATMLTTWLTLRFVSTIEGGGDGVWVREGVVLPPVRFSCAGEGITALLDGKPGCLSECGKGGILVASIISVGGVAGSRNG